MQRDATYIHLHMCACVRVCACVYICECKFIRIMYTPQSGYVYDTRYLQNGFGVQILMYPTNSTNSLLAGCSDWYCFYYYIKNSSKALLQVLFARGRPTTLDNAGCTWRQWLCQVATELRLQVPFFKPKYMRSYDFWEIYLCCRNWQSDMHAFVIVKADLYRLFTYRKEVLKRGLDRYKQIFPVSLSYRQLSAGCQSQWGKIFMVIPMIKLSRLWVQPNCD